MSKRSQTEHRAGNSLIPPIGVLTNEKIQHQRLTSAGH